MREMNLRVLLMLFGLGLANGAGATVPQCDKVPGSDRLLRPGAMVLLGEIHGTSEGPEAVADLACLALDRGFRVAVGLEIPVAEQAAVDLFLESEGTAQDRSKLISSQFWQKDYQDGRSSAAMLELIETLRRYKAEGGQVRVVLFDERTTHWSRDRSMANVLARAYQRDALSFFVALTGNLHSDLTGEGDSGPMGYELRRLLQYGEIVSLRLTHGGGTAWVCTPEECGVVKLRGREATAGIELEPGPAPGSQVGSYHLGEITASPPARDPQPDSSP
jgi:hypothetical protein